MTFTDELSSSTSYSRNEPDPLLEFLMHYGTPRHSGRYPWGSGDDPQHSRNFLSYVEDMKKQGLSESQIAEGLGEGFNTSKLRAMKSIAKNEVRKENISQAQRLHDKGMSNVAIGERMGVPESSVRALLNPVTQQRNEQLMNTADFLKKQINDKKYIDVGAGSEYFAGVSRTKLDHAIAMLREEGYTYSYVNIEQLGTGKKTKLKILSAPDTPYKELYSNRDKIQQIGGFTEDGGHSYQAIQPPKAVSSKRVGVRYGPDGGDQKDGVIELRRGVDDISLGKSRYAQVRISVDGTHYLKGMAMYSDHLPDGVDMLFNTNKKDTGNKMDAMKEIKSDPENPFGAIVRQKYYTGTDGKQHLSPLNIVGAVNPNHPDEKTPGEEGGWAQWSKSLSSQMLSKQTPALIKQQLGLALKGKQDEFNEIMALTNPTVKKRLLESFSDDADSAAVHLKAHALAGQGTHVILPINSLKDTEIYAPKYQNGDKVALVRYPHGGIFEIPELTVNNRNPEANRLIKNAADAVGIHHKVAARLSGADFDGDTVLVIPNNNRQIKTAPPLEGLKGFDPQIYKVPKSERVTISPRTKQLKMGDVSNLITDMTILGAPDSEIVRAVRHSMVVIDAEKHNLDWKQSAKNENIGELKKKYQVDSTGSYSSRGGASTIISRASGKKVVYDQKLRPAAQGGPIDPKTGKKVYITEPQGYTTPATTKIGKNGKTIFVPEKYHPKQVNSTKMAETENAYSLVSKNGGTSREHIYADHANSLKSLANSARKELYSTPTLKYNPSAKAAYRPQVDSLKAKLNIAKKNAPLERQAQIVANGVVAAKRAADPGMDNAQIKKLKGQELNKARANLGARKQRIDITPTEWQAIQAGAISDNFLQEVLKNTDIDKVKQYATPRTVKGLTPNEGVRARAMLSAGHTQAEVAQALGVSTSTLTTGLRDTGG